MKIKQKVAITYLLDSFMDSVFLKRRFFWVLEWRGWSSLNNRGIFEFSKSFELLFVDVLKSIFCFLKII